MFTAELVEELARCLLDDDYGIGEEAFVRLGALMRYVKCDLSKISPERIRYTDGRFYLKKS
jgi:hypothetical protein